MGRVLGEMTPVHLATVPSEREEADRPPEGMDAAQEATGLTRQVRRVVSYCSISGFHRIGVDAGRACGVVGSLYTHSVACLTDMQLPHRSPKCYLARGSPLPG